MVFQRTDNPYPADIRALTSLRFFAAMAVVAFHYVGILPYETGLAGAFCAKGYLAVDFFFVLSGFILSHVYLEQAGTGSFNAKTFYVKRLARVYPVHVFTLAIYLFACLGVWAGGLWGRMEGFTVGEVVRSFFLLHAWGFDGRSPFNAPSWSISAEWFAYLVFPFAAYWLRRMDVVPLLFISFFSFMALWGLTALFWVRPLTSLTSDLGVLRILPEFIMGIACYRFGAAFSFPWHGKRAFAACFCVIIALLVLGAPDFLPVLLFPVLILIAAEHARRDGSGFLSRPFPVWLGEISYSLYMIHFLILDSTMYFMLPLIYGNTVPSPVFHAVWFGMWASLIPLSALAHRYVEQPGRRFITGRLRPLAEANALR